MLTGNRFESNLVGGKQGSDNGRASLAYGVSITDGEFPLTACVTIATRHGGLTNAACVDWEMTVDMLDNLNQVSSSSCIIHAGVRS